MRGGMSFRGCLLVLSCAALFGCGAKTAADLALAQQENAFKELSQEDRELALSQWTCPVCRELLSHAGTPVKAELAGETVFFSKPECQVAYEQNPQKFSSARNE